MPRIQFDPGLLECPDYASPIYAAARAPFINPNTTEEQAIELLKVFWNAGNQADKLRWQQQIDDDNTALQEQQQIQLEADNLRVQNEIADTEAIRKDELKKNKSKYIPIPDRDVPTIAQVIASNYAIRKMEKGLYVELWYYTNAGLDDALRSSNTNDDEAMVMLRQPDGSTSWIPAASTKNATGVRDDKDILWEDFCQAVPRMILAMEEADWPRDRVMMLAQFWGNLQIHEYRSSRDPIDQKTLIAYQAEQRKLWHLAITSPRGAYNISRINEDIMRKTRERVYWDDRRLKDNERDYRVRFSPHNILLFQTKPLFPISTIFPTKTLVNNLPKCCIAHAYMLHYARKIVALRTPTYCIMYAPSFVASRTPTCCITHAYVVHCQ